MEVQCNHSVGGKLIQVPSAKIVNIYGPRGMTRSGRVFAPKYIPKVVLATISTLQEGASIYVPTTLVGAPDSSYN